MPQLIRLTLAAVLLLAPATWGAPELLDRIVAVVDDQVILWSELNFRVLLGLEQQGRSYVPPEQLDDLRAETLERMIDERVLVIKARKDSVVVDETQVDERLNEQLKRIRERLSREEFEQMLERSGLTERQLKARYRKEIRRDLLSSQMRSLLAYRTHITHGDIEAFRQRYADELPPRIFLSQINIKVSPDSSVVARARDRIKAVQERLAAGEAFEAVAKRMSEDPGTAAAGGDLGCFAPGTLLPEFETAAVDLKPGEISEPVQTAFGFHLVQLREKREGEMCAGHILARAAVTPQDKERAEARLEELRRRAMAGEDFAQLAQRYSEDPQTARQGGLWQSFATDQIPAFLRPYLADLKMGEVSRPFFLDDGGHILKINDDQATIENMVREMRMEETVRTVIAEFKGEIHVENRLDESAPGSEETLQTADDAP